MTPVIVAGLKLQVVFGDNSVEPGLRELSCQKEASENLKVRESTSKARPFSLFKNRVPGASFSLEEMEALGNAMAGTTIGGVSALSGYTPLWYYILAEANAKGKEKLGPLGSLIVAESIKRLLKLSPVSILKSNNKSDNKKRNDITPTKIVESKTGRRFLQMSDLILAVNPNLPDPTPL